MFFKRIRIPLRKELHYGDWIHNLFFRFYEFTFCSDLSEFIEQCHKEDICDEIRTESEFIEPDEEVMNPVIIEEFFPQ